MPKNKSSQNGNNSAYKWGTLHTRHPKKLISLLKRLAKDDGRSVSAYAARLIQRAIDLELAQIQQQ